MMGKQVTKRRLILVSNRLPYQLEEKDNAITLKESAGGLVSALKSYFELDAEQQTFTEKIWIGSADFTQKRWQKYARAKEDTNTFLVEPIFIDAKVYNKYYNGFCNATLWPLFHYFPSFVEYDEASFHSYEQVNKLFAEKITSILRPGDILWIHDYQLFPLCGLIREKVPNATIGFFLHIPFPSYEVFRMLHKSWKDKIIHGLLGADLIGFHTFDYVQHFLKTVRMLTGSDHHLRTIFIDNRLVRADLFPIGIDYDKFHNAASDERVIALKESVSASLNGKKMIFSIDRLDYTKGVTYRLAGFERLLEKYPEWLEKVVFLIVVIPSREIISKYNERRKLIEEQVGRINGKYSTLQWQPIIYKYSHLPFDELCALYQAADIGLVTPLRDGMNLVAKEYVASRSQQQGVLILSELAGAANELGEAIHVNPTDKNELAKALNKALVMTAAEQLRALEPMQKRLQEYDVVTWVKDFLEKLDNVKELQAQKQKTYLNQQETKDIIRNYQKAKSRHLLLDYDGTLVPFERHPKEAHPDKSLLMMLQVLASNDSTDVTIISGRENNVLDEWFRDLEVNLIAEHGAAMKLAGEAWDHRNNIDQSWKPAIRATLNLYVQWCPGSFLEEKDYTLAWHYRNVEQEMGFSRSRELLDNLFHLIHNTHLQVIDGNKVIEVRMAGTDKGAAVKQLAKKIKCEFTLAIGDDRTDEDMFCALSKETEEVVTIKVGPGHTNARYSIPSQPDVIDLLNQLAD